LPEQIRIPRIALNPIHYAALYGHVSTLELLLSHGSLYKQPLSADLDGFIGGDNPLHAAAYSGNALGVWAVLNKCRTIDVNSRDRDKKTGKFNLKKKIQLEALFYAAYMGFVECATALRMCGADIEAEDKNGRRAVHVAATYGRLNFLEYLHQNKADLLAKDTKG
jgi:ankyrin repeat protein